LAQCVATKALLPAIGQGLFLLLNPNLKKNMITSPQNDRIKLIRALQSQAKARRKAGQIVLEGVRLIADAQAQGVAPIFALYAAPTSEAATLLESLRGAGVACLETEPALFAELADTENSQGVLAVCPMPPSFIDSLAGAQAGKIIGTALLLDGVADPGNVGTLIRAAAAAGVDLVGLLPGCADAYNPKCLRAGAGGHFRVPLLHGDWFVLRRAIGDLPLYVADGGGDQTYDQIDWRLPAGLIVGGEARGPRDAAWAQARGGVAIPMRNSAESLNAAMAGAIILFEIARQRR
jgi:RNA methyltransferase, TrmH family